MRFVVCRLSALSGDIIYFILDTMAWIVAHHDTGDCPPKQFQSYDAALEAAREMNARNSH